SARGLTVVDGVAGDSHAAAGGDDADRAAVALRIVHAGMRRHGEEAAARSEDADGAGGEEVDTLVHGGAGRRVGADASHAHAAAAEVAAVDEESLAGADGDARRRVFARQRRDQPADLHAAAFDGDGTGAGRIALRDDVRVAVDHDARLAERRRTNGDGAA